MTSRDLARLRRLAIERIETSLAVCRGDASAWTPDNVVEIGAGLWDLYRHGVGVDEPGEVVCRHVAAALEAHLSRDGVPCRVDRWICPDPDPRSPYGGHATLCAEVGGAWYYVEWAYNSPSRKHVGQYSRIRAGATGDLVGLPVVARGARAGEVDVRWMANRSYGRNLTAYDSRVSARTLRRWRLEFLRQRLWNVQEVREGRAASLVGWAKGKRSVLA